MGFCLEVGAWNDFFWAEENIGGGYWWPELSWCLDGHGAFHPNPSELGRLCSFEDVNSLEDSALYLQMF
ncbi:hypothetical protein Bca4012_063345 [Brassica carinata]|uniref:Uncharacterized protein n=1 Tax=Brassica carinata TaxID=52824 RepID=A0A8X7SDP2_BRACI|nr:hypothetical protein Bca52824_032999 [Brassica carinata]